MKMKVCVLLSLVSAFAVDLIMAGNRPYEFTRAGRTQDANAAFEDFEKPSEWSVAASNAVATFERAQDEQLFGDWTGKLVYRASNANDSREVVLRRNAIDNDSREVVLRRNACVPVPDGFDTIGLWVRGTRFGKGANVDPTTPPPDLFAIFRTAVGGELRVKLDRIDWAAWHYVHVRLKPAERKSLKGAAFVGLALTGRFQPDDRVLHFDSLSLFKEEFKPLALKPRAKRPLKPLPNADQGINTGDGYLPFPTREETILPDVVEPKPGEVLAHFTGGAIAGNDTSALKVTTKRVGRTLIVDFSAPAGAVTELSAGLPDEAEYVRTIQVPFLAYESGNGSGGRAGVEELKGGLFRLALFDWYRSNASAIKIRETPRGCQISVVYRPRTDGTYVPLSERLFITLSPDFTGVFPNIPNPMSPWKHVSGQRAWRCHASYNREEDAKLWRFIHRFGMREVLITDHETMWRTTGESYTLRTYADPMKGGDEAQNAYTRLLRDELGFAYGPYNNYVGLAPVNEHFTLDIINRRQDNSLTKSWMRAYGIKSAFGPQLCEEIIPQIQKKFNFNTVYCDVFTAWKPWTRTDYDARVPGAGTFSATLYEWGEVLMLQKKHFNGPVWSEGASQMFLTGVADGSYGQDWGYRCGERPWIVDFDLLKLHPLATDFGMGSLSMFSPGKTELEKMYYLPNAPTPAALTNLVDRFLGATLAFGHSGYLILDYLFDPPKPFGLAYGLKGKLNITDDGLALAMKSYFMTQAIAARYTLSTVDKIRYVSPEGKLLDTTAAVRSNAYELNQVCVRYRDGTVIVANGGTQRLKTEFDGKSYDLPPGGYHAETADGKIVEDASDANGTRADYCASPDYIYIDGRDAYAERPLAKASGTAVARREGNGWEIISLGSKPCSFFLSGKWHDFTFKPGETHRKLADTHNQPAVSSVRLYGPFGDRLNKMIANHIEATDVDMLTRVFSQSDNESWWRTEFWGKYMHSACPFSIYSGSSVLKKKLDAGIDTLLAAQEPSGYLGSYNEYESGVYARLGRGWDIWGIKYTLMGLMHYYDLPRDAIRRKRVLAAARKLCDYLMSKVGPDGSHTKSILTTGGYGGLPSSSVLEPVVWLYRRTRDRRYLDYAAYIVKELTENPEGPQFIKNADVKVADWRFEVLPERYKKSKSVYVINQLTKAYEFMSCCQGLLEYATETERKDLIEAVRKIGHRIVDEEINLAGGSASGEHWYHGAKLQYQHRSGLQETCVLTTWMRLCEKLNEITDEPFWLDQLEKTFYGAYLASMNLNGDCFAAYTPLVGYRSIGHEHCRMHTNCCNANGPRGYLALLNRLYVARGSEHTFNFYASAAMGDFTMYSSYPRDNNFEIGYRGKTARRFKLRLRIPAFSDKTKIKITARRKVLEKYETEVKSGSYFTIDREWQPSDVVTVEFSMPVAMHRCNDYVAFTRGPICLARDNRFHDGALDEEIGVKQIKSDTLAGFTSIRPPDPAMYMAVAAALPSGSHTECVYGKHPSVIHFTDYASAGNLWRDDNRYRVWLPALINGRDY